MIGQALSSTVKARLRLAAVAVALIPIGYVAKTLNSERAVAWVILTGARAWKTYDVVVRRD